MNATAPGRYPAAAPNLVLLHVEIELGGAVPGGLVQAVTLDMVRVGQADRPDSLSREPPVDLVEVVADQLLLGVGDLALVRLAGVLEGGVIQAVPA